LRQIGDCEWEATSCHSLQTRHFYAQLIQNYNYTGKWLLVFFAKLNFITTNTFLVRGHLFDDPPDMMSVSNIELELDLSAEFANYTWGGIDYDGNLCDISESVVTISVAEESEETEWENDVLSDCTESGETLSVTFEKIFGYFNEQNPEPTCVGCEDLNSTFVLEKVRQDVFGTYLMIDGVKKYEDMAVHFGVYSAGWYANEPKCGFYYLDLGVWWPSYGSGLQCGVPNGVDVRLCILAYVHQVSGVWIELFAYTLETIMGYEYMWPYADANFQPPPWPEHWELNIALRLIDFGSGPFVSQLAPYFGYFHEPPDENGEGPPVLCFMTDSTLGYATATTEFI